MSASMKDLLARLAKTDAAHRALRAALAQIAEARHTAGGKET